MRPLKRKPKVVDGLPKKSGDLCQLCNVVLTFQLHPSQRDDSQWDLRNIYLSTRVHLQ
jgi:hypothetical protein